MMEVMREKWRGNCVARACDSLRSQRRFLSTSRARAEARGT